MLEVSIYWLEVDTIRYKVLINVRGVSGQLLANHRNMTV